MVLICLSELLWLLLFFHPFDFKLCSLSVLFSSCRLGFLSPTGYSFWFVTQQPKLTPDLILHSLRLFIMGDFEIYADALKHPLLQTFNDLLNFLSLSHYVNFPSCKMGHTLELGLLLHLHHGNILPFFFFSFAFISSLWTIWRCLSISLLFLWCLPAAQGSVVLLNQWPHMKMVLRASQSLLPGSGCLLYVSSFPQQYGIPACSSPACSSFSSIHLVQSAVTHIVAILVFIAFFHEIEIHFSVFLQTKIRLLCSFCLVLRTLLLFLRLVNLLINISFRSRSAPSLLEYNCNYF